MVTRPRPHAIGIDIGGTFTDVMIVEADGSVHVAKGLSTPDAFERGILRLLERLLPAHGLAAADCATLAHGTTIATNAIIERRGAPTGLITTRGFRDVLELRRIRIPHHYDLTWQKPPPLVERHLRLEVDERMAFDGSVVTPLDAASARTALAQLAARGVTSVAVCLINAYANPDHERAIRDIAADVAPALDITLASDLLRELREYERTSTAVVNAYVRPVVRRYVRSLTDGLAALGFRTPLLMMQSNGGVATAAIAAEKPVHIIESGPAAGVVAALDLARRLDIAHVVTLDIGGTTAKASLIEHGAAAWAGEYEVGGGFSRSGRLARGDGYAVRAPTLDISEIGAGGGSIVWLDGGGALQVGPKSAGAAPGPACYRLGGTEPTLTDACLLLGYLSPDGLAGGAVPLDADAATTAFSGRIAAPLGLTPVAAAFGAYRIGVAAMTRAIRSVSTERGKDPRDFTLVAFGGNGGLFAAAIARELELPRVVVPPASGIFSAFGLLCSDLAHHYTQTLVGRTDRIDPERIAGCWRALDAEALATLASEGYPVARATLHRYGELRYVGQTHELRVPWPDGPVTRDALATLAAAFEDLHVATYGHRGDGQVELVNLHLAAAGRPDTPRIPSSLRFPDAVAQPAATRPAWFGDADGWMETARLTRDAVPATPRAGPLVIHEVDATVLVPPDFSVARDGGANLILQRHPAS